MSINLNNSDNSEISTPILAEKFTYYKKKQAVNVNLHAQSLKFYDVKSTSSNVTPPPQQADLVLSLDDVAGVSVGKGHSKSDQRAYLSIYAYVKVATKKNAKRKRKTVELACSKHATFSENLTIVYEWEREINTTLRANLQKRSDTINATCIANIRNPESYLSKPFLIFVNPKSGSGKAKSIYYERVLPVWAESNTKDLLVLTRKYIRIFQNLISF
jgi:hypothetical protein